MRFNGWVVALVAVGVVSLAPAPAQAERGEWAVGIQGGLMLPGFSPTSATSLTLATWTAGVFAEYGILQDLYLTGGFLFSSFTGSREGYKYSEDGLDYEGTLKADTMVYHPQLGLRYKLYAGYNLAPYIDLSFGYAWSVFSSAKLTNSAGADTGAKINDFGEGAFMTTVGLSFDYRVFNMVFLGIGFSYSVALGDQLLKNYWLIPVQATYYWF